MPQGLHRRCVRAWLRVREARVTGVTIHPKRVACTGEGLGASSPTRARSACTMQCIAAFRTMFPLGMVARTPYHSYMNHHNHTRPSKDDSDRHVSDPKSPLVSEILPAFLDHLRVEDHRTPTTLIRYESTIQKFITTVADCPITDFNR